MPEGNLPAHLAGAAARREALVAKFADIVQQHKRPLYVEGSFKFFRCQCGNYQAVNSAMPWCSTCGIEYDIKSSGIILRPNRKTPRYAYGKALNLAGGAKIGGKGER